MKRENPTSITLEATSIDRNTRMFTAGKTYEARPAEGNLHRIVDDLGRERCLFIHGGKARFSLGTVDQFAYEAAYANFTVRP